jgi:hypothetical protein
MNFIDENATPMDVFSSEADLRPFAAQLPTVALDNLFPPDRPTAAMAYYMDLTTRQNLSRPDMADASTLNEIIWFSVKGERDMPGIARLPAFELMTAAIKPEAERESAADDEDE